MNCAYCGKPTSERSTRVNNSFDETAGPDVFWFCHLRDSDCFHLYLKLWEMHHESSRDMCQMRLFDESSHPQAREEER